MPYEIRKIGNCYRVKNKDTKKIKAKCTTKTKADNMVRLLNMLHLKKKTKK